MPHEFRSGHYYIEHRENLPHAVFGRIAVTQTSGRENPPAPLSGFVCDRTPFAKGHIMALELGGPDISANIVPQYAWWQGIGEWRAMETTVAANHNGHFFVAWLSYTFGSHDYAGQYQRCSKQEVFDWNHAYIPTRIEVRILDARASHPVVSSVASALSAPAADERAFAAALEAIFPLDVDRPPLRYGDTFFQYEMPDIDRNYWLGQHVQQIVETWWKDYSAPPVSASTGRARGARKPAAPPRVLLDDRTFTYAASDAVKQALRDERLHNGLPMWEDAYLNATVTPEFCITSRFAFLPKPVWNQLKKNPTAFPYTPKKAGAQ